MRGLFMRCLKQSITCAGCTLDEQQSAAVLSSADAQLVLAAAGSGKTLCLLAKVEHLATVLKLPPASILVISFTNKTVAELRERCKVPGVEIRTFHSLGLNLLKQAAYSHYKNAHLVDEAQIVDFLAQSLASLRRQTSEFAADADELLALFSTFLSLYKNGNWTKERLVCRLADYYRPPGFAAALACLCRAEAPPDRMALIAAKARCSRFLSFFFDIFQRYEAWLKEKHLYDFSDMIGAATLAVQSEAKLATGYRYILVDEVQDLSKNRSALVRAILQKNPGCKLFAVGDDWQSIYRFTGSDLTLIHHFEQLFALKTQRSFIENTHRFGDPILSISSEFIQKNPEQSTKRVRSPTKQNTGLFITPNPPRSLARRCFGQDADTLEKLLTRLLEEQGDALRASSLQVISRYNSDIDRLRGAHFEITAKPDGSNTFSILWRPATDSPPLTLEFCSMHKAKGITRDYVFVLNVNDGPHGVPARRASDQIIDLLLVDPEKYPYAEERRLFYVALTRARRATFLICDYDAPSPFLFELSETFAIDFENNQPDPSPLKDFAKNGLSWLKYALTPISKKVLQLSYGQQLAQTNRAEPA